MRVTYSVTKAPTHDLVFLRHMGDLLSIPVEIYMIRVVSSGQNCSNAIGKFHPTGGHDQPRVPTVRESQGILRESGKTREGQGKVREF